MLSLIPRMRSKNNKISSKTINFAINSELGKRGKANTNIICLTCLATKKKSSSNREKNS